MMNCAEHLNVRLRQVSADFDIFPATCYKEKEQRYISPSKCCRNFKRDVSANCNGSLQKSSCHFLGARLLSVCGRDNRGRERSFRV